MSSRAMMRNPLLRSPLLRSLIAFAAALSALVVGLGVGGDLALGLNVGAAVATLGGVLVLVQSAAISRIRTLRIESKRQIDEIARATFYAEQIGEALAGAHEFREAGGRGGAVELARRLLRTAARRAAVVFDPSACFYLVETTPQWHVVQATSGTTRFEIEVGKCCRGDRSLDEALGGIGNYWHKAPLSLEGVNYNLVLLADRPPGQAERTLLSQLALVLCLADASPARTTRSGGRSSAQLRVV